MERVERDLLGRSGALLGGSIGTFDDVFERIAAGNGNRRPVVSDTQRALLLRRVVAGASLGELGASARFSGFADALGSVVAELESGLLDPGDLDGDLAELYRPLPRGARPPRPLGPGSPARATRPIGSPATSPPGTAGRCTPTASKI